MPEDRKIRPVGGLRNDQGGHQLFQKGLQVDEGQPQNRRGADKRFDGVALKPLQTCGFSPGEKVVVIYRPIFVWKFFFLHFFPVKRIPAQTIKRHLTLITSLVTSFPNCFRMPRCLYIDVIDTVSQEPKNKNSPKSAMVLESSTTSARWASD